METVGLVALILNIIKPLLPFFSKATYILVMLILISLLILVHEFGHFLAAKIFGVKVSRFALGMPFGPTLFRKKIGETEFLIHAFLMGGYVSFPDDTEEEESKECDPTSELLHPDSPKRFKNKAPWQQAVVISAGVVANVVFALFLVFATALYYGKLPSGKAEIYIKDFVETTSNVQTIGVQANDRVLALNGIEVDSVHKLIFVVQKSKFFDDYAPKEVTAKKFEELKALNQLYKDGETIPAGDIVVLPVSTPEKPLSVSEDVASGFEKYSPDEVKLNKKEQKIRDLAYEKQVIKLEEPTSLEELARAISDSYKPITIKVLRDGKEITYDGIYTDKEGRLGIGLATKEIFVPTKSVKSASLASWNYLVDKTQLILKGLWQIVTGKIPLQDLHGIVAITKIGGDIIEHQGLLNGLLLTAIISINLAIINLLPIPAVDGGHLMFLFLEKIRGRKFEEKTLEKVNSIFFMGLLALMVLIILNDIFALIIGKF